MLTLAKESQKSKYDRSSQTHKYAVGDAVWLLNPHVGGHRKFKLPYEGRYCILEHLPLLNYRIRLWGNQYGHTQVVHHNRLKPCYDPVRLAHRGSPPESHVLPVEDSWNVDESDSDESTTTECSNTNCYHPYDRWWLLSLPCRCEEWWPHDSEFSLQKPDSGSDTQPV